VGDQDVVSRTSIRLYASGRKHDASILDFGSSTLSLDVHTTLLRSNILNSKHHTGETSTLAFRLHAAVARIPTLSKPWFYASFSSLRPKPLFASYLASISVPTNRAYNTIQLTRVSHFSLDSLHFLVYKISINKNKTMSEESKTAEGDFVMMKAASGNSAVKMPAGLDDPNLSQEDRDHRLAIALQQQENVAAFDVHKKKHDDAVAATSNRTARSGTFTKLAAVRQKDQGMLSVPADYTTENAFVKSDGTYMPPNNDEEMLKGATPQQIADFKLAKELQKVEQVGAGTAREMGKIVTEEVDEAEAQAHRTERSNYHLP
jgi:hypothetical protein